jgi:hypothetical protein
MTPPALHVAIDIRPGEFPNNINLLSHGKIPVAMLASPEFTPSTQVDRGSVRFGSTGAEASPIHWELLDVNGDGRLDLVCLFNTDQTGFSRTDTVGVLKARTLTGLEITGADSIRIVPRPGH